MTRGRFITFEGGEGAGKTTQLLLLSKALDRRRLPHIVTREPGGTPGAEALRELLLSPEHDWGPRAEALLFAAARSDHVETLIEPALAAGQWVLCDRFLDSSRAYQGGAGGIGDTDVMNLHRIGSGGLLPDRTILFTIDADEAVRRAGARDRGNPDRIGGKSAAYHADVAARFNALAAAEPERFAVVSADATPEDVHDRVIAALSSLMDDA
ncbi:dTMP kinase [Croceicoccus naphthovorans]|uniref:Thymidylate kinase n=1 Tax=Croceicoccus naphthovorans TaxID=1348774 RepID=A0A0G3XHH2_9SPHN|nr:dTMP kinase [Croceicoccus naphthovorans]AKM10046.1 thymidylate kinase [Croceicoccus naphthovorans]MBB3991242.1 dTMP kinase [Croceicoccus naphthovorans]